MEPDTVPYDADEAAWEGWQVPSSAAFSEQQVPSGDQVTEDAIPPTLCYDTFMADPQETHQMEDLSASHAEVDAGATLAYEADAGGVPQPWHSSSAPAVPPAHHLEAATQQYGDTLVLDHDGDTQELPEEPVAPPSPPPAPAASAPAAPAADPVAEPVAAPAAALAVAPEAAPVAVPVAVPVAAPTVAPVAAPAPAAAPAVAPVAAPAPAAAPAVAPVAAPAPAAPAAAGGVSPRAAPAASPRAATASPGRSPAAAAAASASKVRRRLHYKQPAPPGYSGSSKPKAPKRKSAPARMARPAAASLPAMAGCRVRVKGDGWGGKGRGYDATVVDGDELSLTVIFVGENKKHEETQVLREFCTLLESAVEEPKTSRRRTC